MNFGPNQLKRVFPIYTRKNENHHRILHIQISLGSKYFSFNKQFWFFGPNLPKKRYFRSKTEKWTLSFNSACLILPAKFLLNLKILIFWNKFAPKWHFQSKTEIMNTTIEFCIFELRKVPNFSVNYWLKKAIPRRFTK